MKQPAPKDTVDCLFHRFAGAAVFLFEERGDIIVDGEGLSHIMMLSS